MCKIMQSPSLGRSTGEGCGRGHPSTGAYDSAEALSPDMAGKAGTAAPHP